MRLQPFSRAAPHFARGALEAWLPEAGIEYVWAKDLGNPALVNAQRARRGAPPDARARPFEELLTTRDVRAALDALARRARAAPPRARVAIMCAEETWARDAAHARARAPPAPRGRGGACHRWHIAEELSARRGFDVRHILPGGALEPHVAPAVPAWARAARAAPGAGEQRRIGPAGSGAEGGPASRGGDPTTQRESKRKR